MRYFSFSHRWFLLSIYLFLLFLPCYADLAQETIYLTWQNNPSTTMTIQWITPSRIKETAIVYRQHESKEWVKATGESFPFPRASQYLIHRVELHNLLPGKDYEFRVLPYPEVNRFLTAPVNLDQEIRFVVGGDMYHDSLSIMSRTSRLAATTEPLFALIGGDIAYAVMSGFFGFQMIDRWVDWIKAWHKDMVTPKGYLVPVVAAIGNHDLNGGYDQTPAQAAVFSVLFPMPGPQIYNVLDFGSYLSIFILDSGHANPISGKQTDWLRSTLNQRQQVTHRFAIYHIPAYPSVRDYRNKYGEAIRAHWVPVFEQGRIQAAFEHHDHAYKRTHPLLKGRIHPDGILYLGDGGWGVEKPRLQKTKSSYLAKFSSSRHFIAVRLTGLDQKFKCIDDQGKILDEYTQALPSTTTAKTSTSSPSNSTNLSIQAIDPPIVNSLTPSSP